MGNGLVKWRGEERGGNERKMKRRGATRVGLHPMSEIQKYAEGRADLIFGGSNSDVYRGRQTPLRRHCGCHDEALIRATNCPVFDCFNKTITVLMYIHT